VNIKWSSICQSLLLTSSRDREFYCIQSVHSSVDSASRIHLLYHCHAFTILCFISEPSFYVMRSSTDLFTPIRIRALPPPFSHTCPSHSSPPPLPHSSKMINIPADHNHHHTSNTYKPYARTDAQRITQHTLRLERAKQEKGFGTSNKYHNERYGRGNKYVGLEAYHAAGSSSNIGKGTFGYHHSFRMRNNPAPERGR